MCRGAAAGILAVLVLLVGTSVAQAAEPLRPLRASVPPVIDGRLDEDLWQRAPSATDFKTWLPDLGADLSERTIVYYAYDQGYTIEFADITHDTLLEMLPAATCSRQDASQAGQLARTSSGAALGVTAKYGITAQLTVVPRHGASISKPPLRSPRLLDYHSP